MGEMKNVVGVVIGITISVIVAGSILFPTISEYTGDGGSLASYATLIAAVGTMVILAILMMAVRAVQKD